MYKKIKPLAALPILGQGGFLRAAKSAGARRAFGEIPNFARPDSFLHYEWGIRS